MQHLGMYRCVHCKALGHTKTQFGHSGQRPTHSGPIIPYLCCGFHQGSKAKRKCRTIATVNAGEYRYCYGCATELKITEDDQEYFDAVSKEKDRATKANEDAFDRMREARTEIAG